MSTFAYFMNATYASTINVLGVDDDLYVGPLAHLLTNSGNAFEAHGSAHSFVIDGSVAGYYGGVRMGDNKYDVNQVLTVHENGVVMGEHGSGAVLTGTHSWVSNEGKISGWSAGLELNGIGQGTESTVNNAGYIGGDNYGITRYSSASTETLVIHNTGMIVGPQASFNAMGSNAVEKITNEGTMSGSVDMGGGNDFFDSSKGVFANGWILMGAGNDTAKGSAAADFISGGAGHDLVTGNGGADQFVFKPGDTYVGPTGADRITDFSHSQHDKINLMQFDAVQNNNSGDDAFHWIATQAFHHKSGELHYYVSGGNAYVQGDVNGDAVSDFTIRLDHVTSLVQGDFVL